MDEELQKNTIQEANRQAVVAAFRTLVQQHPKIDIGESVEVPVTLTEGTRRFRYERGTIPNMFHFIDISILTEGEEPLVNREFLLYERPPNLIEIESTVRTQPEAQSKGYVSGLMLLSDDVIEHAINSFGWDSNRVVARIIDSARPQYRTSVERDRWSTTYAQKLGYRRDQFKEDSWVKVYRQGK